MIALALICIAAALLYHQLVRAQRYWKGKGVPQVESTPILGSLYENLVRRKSIAELIGQFYLTFKNHRYVGLYNLTTPILLVNDTELIKTLTIKDFDHFTDHMNHAEDELDPLWSRNIFAMIGEPWRDMRATLSPAFTSSKMKFMFNLINDCAENFADYYLKQNQDLITLEMKDTCSRATNDIIASCAFGIKCDSLQERQNDFYMKARSSFDFSGFRQYIFFLYNACPKIMKWLGIKVFKDDIAKFFRGVINETVDARQTQRIVRPDMIHLLLETRKGKLLEDDASNVEDSFASTKEYSLQRKAKKVNISNEDITAQALIFFLGGFDTTSYLMCFLAYELAVNPDIQEKLRGEIQETLRTCNGKLTYEALMKMKYLDMVVSEVLRKWPPATVTDRICTKDYTIKASKAGEKDLHLKRNDVLWFPIYGIHRDPEFYPKPEIFDPERFGPENRGKLNAAAYLPFGSGPRNCIGSRFAIMENKTMLFQLLRKFKIVPSEKTSVPLKICRNNLNLTSANGFWLGLERL